MNYFGKKTTFLVSNKNKNSKKICLKFKTKWRIQKKKINILNLQLIKIKKLV